MSIQAITPQMCPECGHHSSGIVAGRCSAFVPTPEGPALAGYCAHLCYDAITDRSWVEDRIAAFRPDGA